MYEFTTFAHLEIYIYGGFLDSKHTSPNVLLLHSQEQQTLTFF
jgi:hypothetical protein